jgi:hypothetical protein
MGCIPSKQVVLEDGTVMTKRELKRMNKQRGPPTPDVEGELPPWLAGHRVVTVDEKGRLSERGW